jgi:single-strand DNA-binding protein
MKSLNKVTLIGNVGSEPELKKLANDIKVAKLSLATSETYKDSQGQSHTETEWHTIILWRNMAEIAQKYIKKGSLLYIEGKLKTRNYTNEQGSKRYVTEIIVEEIILLDKKAPENKDEQ